MSEQCDEPQPGCKYFGTAECLMTTHHDYFPSKDYKTKIEKNFRQLPENKIRISRCLHDDVHLELLPPPKPPRDEMIQALAQTVIRSET